MEMTRIPVTHVFPGASGAPERSLIPCAVPEFTKPYVVGFDYLLQMHERKPDAKILVVRDGHLGDLITMTGALRVLHQWFPEFEITVKSSPQFVCALATCVDVQEQCCEANPSDFDLVVSLSGFVETSPERFMLPRNTVFGRAFGLTDQCSVAGSLASPNAVQREAANAVLEKLGLRFTSRYAVIAPNASHPSRTLSESALNSLMGWLRQSAVSYITATAETMSLDALIGIVHYASLVISGDNGVYHLAEALEVPSVAVFGPVLADLRIRYYEHVLGVQSLAPCSPCNECGGDCDMRCVHEVDIDSLLGSCEEHIRPV